MTYRGFSKKRNIFIPLLVCIGYFLIFSPFNADASDTGEKEIRLTLSQVVEFALATDSQILDAQDNVKIAQSNRRIAQKEKGFNPTVQVTGDIALVGEAESNARVSISDSIALNETSSDLANQLEQADLALNQAQNALKNAQENTKLKAITAYLEVLKAEWTTEMAQRTLEQAHTLQADIENQYQLGMASSVDLLKAKQTVERARINLDQSNQNLAFLL
jgi:outer membrane protein TolC